jgi:hypothetical protein
MIGYADGASGMTIWMPVGRMLESIRLMLLMLCDHKGHML